MRRSTMNKMSFTSRLSFTFSIFFCFTVLFAQANTYKVEVDYQHQLLKHTDTRNTVTFKFIDTELRETHIEVMKGVYPISSKKRSFEFSTDKELIFFTVTTNGNDAFFIDQIMIFKNGSVVQNYGSNDGKGYCLSTDLNDTNGSWKKYLKSNCETSRMFQLSSNNKLEQSNVLGEQRTTAGQPTHQLNQSEESWTYHNNESRSEINAEGLGRCYDIRYIDPINWSNESLQSGQRASVISLARDDSKRPARHNNKDYVVPKGVVFTSEIIGDSEAESRFAATAYEYENEVLRDYRADVGVPKAGNAKMSAAFNDVNSSSGSNSSLYAFSKMYKQFYKLDLFFDDPSHQHYIDQRFWQGVKDLGHDLSAMDFIDKFGSHYASTTYYGGNFFQRRTISQSEYAYYESNESEFKADIAGTIKKVNFKVGSTQGFRNSRGETERVEMSSAKIFTVGGDLNQYRPDLWSKSVLKNLAVVKVKLTRLSDLLTTQNFPDVPNIAEKRKLLEDAIRIIEKEAEYTQSSAEGHGFFTKKSAKYRLTVSYIKCKGHGQNEAGGNSEYYGNIKMAFFNRNGTALKTTTCFNKAKGDAIDLTINQTYDINKKVNMTIGAADIAKGYISVYGQLKELDLGEVPLSNISKHDSKSKIYFRDALDHRVTKKVTFTSKYGDKVEAHFKLERL